MRFWVLAEFACRLIEPNDACIWFSVSDNLPLLKTFKSWAAISFAPLAATKSFCTCMFAVPRLLLSSDPAARLIFAASI
ncbi:hypothetical protein D3C71_1144880 [compost metagenome]